jgi:hypothetical protein
MPSGAAGLAARERADPRLYLARMTWEPSQAENLASCPIKRYTEIAVPRVGIGSS